MPLTPEEQHALDYAIFYRDEHGLNPLPSRMDRKQPFFRYAHLWETPAPPEWFTPDGWPRTCNVQVMCGSRWGLFVVDLDGREARERFEAMGDCPRTWVSHRPDGESRHLWFRTPDWHRKPVRKSFLWRGDGDHEAIEILGERSLVVAPPSRHVKTGGQYRFLDPAHSPERCAAPARAPRWLLDAIADRAAPHAPQPTPPRPKLSPRAADPEVPMSRDEILDAIRDKVGLARQWGVRFTGRVSPTGWAECHGLGRPDNNPSAAMHVETGVFTDRGTGETLSFFDLMRETGNAHDFQDACARLAGRI